VCLADQVARLSNSLPIFFGTRSSRQSRMSSGSPSKRHKTPSNRSSGDARTTADTGRSCTGPRRHSPRRSVPSSTDRSLRCKVRFRRRRYSHCTRSPPRAAGRRCTWSSRCNTTRRAGSIRHSRRTVRRNRRDPPSRNRNRACSVRDGIQAGARRRNPRRYRDQRCRGRHLHSIRRGTRGRAAARSAGRCHRRRTSRWRQKRHSSIRRTGRDSLRRSVALLRGRRHRPQRPRSRTARGAPGSGWRRTRRAHRRGRSTRWGFSSARHCTKREAGWWTPVPSISPGYRGAELVTVRQSVVGVEERPAGSIEQIRSPGVGPTDIVEGRTH
jgi:hypothetical protein